MVLRKRCRCGSVRFEVDETAIVDVVCDCPACKIVHPNYSESLKIQVYDVANPANVIFSLKDLKLVDEAKEMRFFTTGMEGESPVQQWYCDCCDSTLFLVAP